MALCKDTQVEMNWVAVLKVFNGGCEQKDENYQETGDTGMQRCRDAGWLAQAVVVAGLHIVDARQVGGVWEGGLYSSTFSGTDHSVS